MRNFIDIITEATLDEERLDEKAWFTIELKKNQEDLTVAVFDNPRRSTLLRFANAPVTAPDPRLKFNPTATNGGNFRGFLKADGNVVVFDAYRALHMDMGRILDAGGAKRFEIRGPNRATGDEIASILFIPREFEGEAQEWRAQPMVQRMFGNDTFHIGLMR